MPILNQSFPKDSGQITQIKFSRCWQLWMGLQFKWDSCLFLLKDTTQTFPEDGGLAIASSSDYCDTEKTQEEKGPPEDFFQRDRQDKL